MPLSEVVAGEHALFHRGAAIPGQVLLGLDGEVLDADEVPYFADHLTRESRPRKKDDAFLRNSPSQRQSHSQRQRRWFDAL